MLYFYKFCCCIYRIFIGSTPYKLTQTIVLLTSIQKELSSYLAQDTKIPEWGFSNSPSFFRQLPEQHLHEAMITFFHILPYHCSLSSHHSTMYGKNCCAYQITWYLRSLTLHTAVVSMVQSLVGSGQHGQATLCLFQNIYSFGNRSTLSNAMELLLSITLLSN
jgi:hypothetical protein